MPTDRPVIDLVPNDAPQERWSQWLPTIARQVNLLLGGKMNATNAVTLTANDTSTLLYDSRIGFYSHVSLEPQTASAATARAGVWIESMTGVATIHHASAADTDQTFSVLIIG